MTTKTFAEYTEEDWRPLLEFASLEQTRAVEALRAQGSNIKGAKALGISLATFKNRLKDLRRKAARQGIAPRHDMTKSVPEGFSVKGVSSLYGEDGELKAQWVKSTRDEEERIQALLTAVSEIAEPFRAASTFVLPPEGKLDADLLTVYPFGDPHIGMHAWAEECGEDFDLEIAEAQLCAAVDHLVELAPASERAWILNLGDFFHADNNSARTAKSGNALDVDSRWAKVFRVGVRIMRRCIDRALEKHQFVDVLNEIGNHDDHSAVVLGVCLAQFYENNPRVRVDLSPAKFHWLRHGRCLFGVTHGDTVKLEKLPLLMATDRAQDWGETRYRHFYTGHVHHDSLKEFPGCTVETFRTLAAKDAWHAAAGYRSDRDLKLDVWHREYGKVVRHIVGIEQLPYGRKS